MFKKKKQDDNKTVSANTKKKSNTSTGIKIFIWFMFIAMLSSFILPLLYYIKSIS